MHIYKYIFVYTYISMYVFTHRSVRAECEVR